MLLNPPKIITWLLAIALGVTGILLWPQVGVITKPTSITISAAVLAFWLEAAAFGLLGLSVLFRRL